MKPGRYECTNQLPIIVVDGGELPDGHQGPWVSYRFDWQTDAEAVSVIFYAFDALITLGYHHVDDVTPTP